MTMRYFSINYRDPKNPKVFMEFTRNKEPIGRIEFEVSIIPLIKILAVCQPLPQDGRELPLIMCGRQHLEVDLQGQRAAPSNY